ncbi:MAG: hypothetical protein C5B49_03935 [Bdellovibrio sp.]|nr:MAG: hypothetical protein C5B49_03935 [Bdellovibrio sp.]
MLTVLALLILALPFQFTFQADDYLFLRRTYGGAFFDISGYESQMTRNPLLYIFMIPTFSSHLFDFHFAPMYLYFSIYVAGLSLCLRALHRDLALSRLGVECSTVLNFLPLVCLNPNQAEVLFFPICMPYSVGIFALGGMAYCRRAWVKIFFMLVAFTMLETFFLPALALLVVQNSASKPWKVRQFASPVGLWTLAVVLILVIRHALSYVFPSFHYPISIDFSRLPGQLGEIAHMLITIYFYKINWVLTAVEWLAIGFLTYSLFSRHMIRKHDLGLLILLVLSCDVHVLIMPYSAMRAHFGAIFLEGVLLAFLLALVQAREKRLWLRRTMVILFGLAFVLQLVHVFTIKNANYLVLQKIENEMVQKIDSCTQPCHLHAGDLSRDLKRDWVLPRNFWLPYLEWIRFKNRPAAQVEFEISD